MEFYWRVLCVHERCSSFIQGKTGLDPQEQSIVVPHVESRMVESCAAGKCAFSLETFGSCGRAWCRSASVSVSRGKTFESDDPTALAEDAGAVVCRAQQMTRTRHQPTRRCTVFFFDEVGPVGTPSDASTCAREK